MKYPNWETYTDKQKQNAVEDELRLDTHNGTSKDDFLNIIHYLSKQNKRLRGEEKPSGGKMNRLTNTSNGIVAIPKIPMCCKTQEEITEFLKQRGYYYECFIKLFAYEDTGLEPAEIATLKEENVRLRRICASFKVSGEVFE